MPLEHPRIIHNEHNERLTASEAKHIHIGLNPMREPNKRKRQPQAPAVTVSFQHYMPYSFKLLSSGLFSLESVSK